MLIRESYTVSLAPRYVRVKRQNQTYFVTCNKEDTFSLVKEQVALANQDHSKDQIRLVVPKDGTIIEDDWTLEKFVEDAKDEFELFCVFQISDSEWEPVATVPLDSVGGQ